MNMKVFAVWDSKALYFKSPFNMRSKGEALRGFSDVANDVKTEIGRHPEDFTLFCLGEFDSLKGKYVNPVQESLGLAVEYVKVPDTKIV